MSLTEFLRLALKILTMYELLCASVAFFVMSACDDDSSVMHRLKFAFLEAPINMALYCWQSVACASDYMHEAWHFSLFVDSNVDPAASPEAQASSMEAYRLGRPCGPSEGHTRHDRRP